MMKMITPPEDEAVAKNYIAFLRQGQFDQIRKDLDPKMADAFDRATFEKMRALIPAGGEPTSVKVVGAYTQRQQVYRLREHPAGVQPHF